VTAVDPKTVLDHPFAQRLARNPAIVLLAQFLTSERRAEVRVVAAHEARKLSSGHYTTVIQQALQATPKRQGVPFELCRGVT